MINKNQRGFTLIEILVATGILALISVVVTQILFSTTRSNNKTEILKEVKQNGDFAIEQMTRMIRSANTVTTPCSVDGTVTGSLEIQNPDNLLTRFDCQSSEGTLRLASNSASFLTSNNLSLTRIGGQCSLQFICKTVAGIPRTVTIFFGLQQKQTTVGGTPPDQSVAATTNFETSVTLRN